MKLYFRDNFFSSGRTEILNEAGAEAGELDLKSAFKSSVDVYREDGSVAASGKFRFFSNKWEIVVADGRGLGVLRSRFSFFTKKYTYETAGGASYTITSPAFSKEYDVFDDAGHQVARFERVSGWFSSGAFCLENRSEQLDSYELICVVMGMHAIQKRQNAASSSAST
ncbi:hypothetical protein LOK74_04680 [Brevibacillus humidisoli]|uniref:hypothetical protein n=1 Tax=Brevibacillus humidisoli TaxID=2895522 RepID=UPI001E5B7A9A|nr:hypothetical protein [Brevibacillus humidisoli]UFJ41803.1 hypothetical protein LOK74_04680 [Brevibacillus humidisoli]